MSLILLNLICFSIIAPFAVISLTLMYVYRFFVENLLKIQLKDKFLGLLEGTDCVWAVEESSSLSVINVLAVLEMNEEENDRNLLKELRALVENILVEEDPVFEKFLSLRNKRYGYFYWERYDDMSIENHVRWLQDDEATKNASKGGGGGKICNDDLKDILSNVSNKPLPLEHKTCWEILVSRSHLKPDNFDQLQELEEGRIINRRTNFRNAKIIPIVFRIHHSLGDGVALLRLFLEAIADKRTADHSKYHRGLKQNFSPEILPKLNIEENSKFSHGNVALERNDKIDVESYANLLTTIYHKDLLAASMPFSPLFNLQFTKRETIFNWVFMKLKMMKHTSFHGFCCLVIDFLTNRLGETKEFLASVVCEKIHKMAKLMSILVMSPGCLVQQALRSMDNSALHGPELSGAKVVSYWMETDYKCDQELNLLTKIQQVKTATGTKFSDVILAALSSSIRKYFTQLGEFAPKTLTVVMPARISSPNKELKLENGFSVGLLPLCISGTNESVKTLTAMERLFHVSRSSEKLRNDPDYLVNFWVMKWLSSVLPETFLRPVLESHSTLIFSNLPGPQEVHFMGHRMKNIAFWVPNRSKTGIGVSVLSYGGSMHLSLMADKAVIKSVELLNDILENTVGEIENLHDTIFLTRFSKSLHFTESAPTNEASESCDQEEQEKKVISKRENHFE